MRAVGLVFAKATSMVINRSVLQNNQHGGLWNGSKCITFPKDNAKLHLQTK